MYSYFLKIESDISNILNQTIRREANVIQAAYALREDKAVT